MLGRLPGRLREWCQEAGRFFGRRRGGVPPEVVYVAPVERVLPPSVVPILDGDGRIIGVGSAGLFAQIRREESMAAAASPASSGSLTASPARREDLTADVRVIIVDDDKIMGKTLHRHLIQSGAKNVIWFQNPQLALAAVENYYDHDFHEGRSRLVLFSDFNMPEMNGDQMIRAIRAIEATRGIRKDQVMHIVGMSAEATEERNTEFLNAGANQFVPKTVLNTPATRADLFGRLPFGSKTDSATRRRRTRSPFSDLLPGPTTVLSTITEEALEVRDGDDDGDGEEDGIAFAPPSRSIRYSY